MVIINNYRKLKLTSADRDTTDFKFPPRRDLPYSIKIRGGSTQRPQEAGKSKTTIKDCKIVGCGWRRRSGYPEPMAGKVKS